MGSRVFFSCCESNPDQIVRSRYSWWSCWYARCSQRYELVRYVLYGILVVAFLTGVILFYNQYEGWTVQESVFFVIATMSTVGYGSPAPSDDSSRLFTIFFIIIGIAVIFAGISDFVHTHLTYIRDYLCKSTAKQVAEDISVGDLYYYRRLLMRYVCYIILLLLVGTIFLKYNEKWTWIMSLYFVTQTSSTVGYGDLSIKHSSTITFICIYVVFSTFLIAGVIRAFNATMEETKQIEELEAKLRKMQSLRFYRSLNIVNGMSKYEVVLSMLTYSGVLQQSRDIDPWLQKFDECNTSQSGNFTDAEYQLFLEKESAIAGQQLQILMDAKRLTMNRILLGVLPHSNYFSPQNNTNNEPAMEYNNLDIGSMDRSNRRTPLLGVYANRRGENSSHRDSKNEAHSPLQFDESVHHVDESVV